MNRRSMLGLLVFLAVAGSWLLARTDPDDPATVLAKGRDLLAAGQYAEAADTLGKVGGDVAKDETAKEAVVLRIHALVLAKKGEDAAKFALATLEAWPKTEAWRGRVESLLAKAAEVQGKVADAATLELASAKAVLTDEHHARVAATFFAWATLFAKGEKSPDGVRPAISPDLPRAIDAYRLGIGALDRESVAAPYWIEVARLHLGLGQGAEAERAAHDALAIVKKYKTADVPEVVMAARTIRAEALLLLNNPVEARTEILALMKMPSLDETAYGPKAAILLGRSHVQEGGAEGLALAKTAYGRFLKTWPDRPEAPAVRRAIAAACLDAGALDQALPALKDVIEGAKAPVDDQAWARFQTAVVLGELKRFDEARAAYQQFLAQHPAHPDVPNAQKKLPESLLAKAALLLADHQRVEAIEVYRQFVSEYPLSDQAPGISIEIGNELRRLKKPDEARDAYRDARERYRTAQPVHAAQAGLLLGIVEEEDRRDLEAAALAYRAVMDGFNGMPAAAEATGRLGRLTGIELELRSPRIFAPSEAASVELATRNVREATVRIYRLDARGYFERKGTLNGTESLDVALVKADQTHVHAVPDFVRYRRDETSVALKLGDQPLAEGTYVVTAEAEQRRAVVLVVVSRLLVVVKQSPTEVFAWATDTTSGAPLAGVEVLVRGKGLKEAKKTEADGTARFAFKAGQGPCEVIGALGASVAPGLAPPPAAPGTEQLTPRVHFAFDRPVYRPGDDVRWSAILRSVADGQFVTPDDKIEVAVSWVDPRGRTLYQSRHRPGAFGTIDGSFRVPADGAVGDYSIRVEFANQIFNEVVSARAYVKPEATVNVRIENAVVRPGDTVPVKLSFESLSGGVIAGAAFEWRVYRVPAAFDATRYRDAAWFYHAVEKTREARPEPNWIFCGTGNGVTDDKGQGECSFTTESAGGAWRYMVMVTAQDATRQPVSGTASAWSAWTPGNIVVLPDRRAYRAGDRVTARIIGVDWAGRPLAVKGKAQLILRGTEAGRPVEQVLSEATVDLGATGEAEVKLEARKAGAIIVRFVGEDAHGMKVAGDAGAQVSGERPDLAKEARILFEREVYRAGEKARLFIEVPAAPVTGLLTFEGETVLMHRIITVSEKSSVVEIELPEFLAPNVVASWSVPHDHRLLTSEDPVIVLRYLNVDVTATPEVAKPGETVKLSVKATDQAGHPVAAALALAMSDAALESLGGVGTQDPRFVFNRDTRRHLVKTGASHAFRISAAAAAIDADVISLGRTFEALSKAQEVAKNVENRAYLVQSGTAAEPKLEARPGDVTAWTRGGEAGGLVDGVAPGQAGGSATGGGGGGVAKGSAFGGSLRRSAAGRVAPAKTPGAPAEGRKQDAKFKDAEKKANEDDALLVLDEAQDSDKSLRNQAPGNEPAGAWAHKYRRGESERELRRDVELSFRGIGDDSGGAGIRGAGFIGGFEAFGLPAVKAIYGWMPPELREVLVDVAAWNPRLVTDDAGLATLDVKVPDNLTVWSVNASGTTKQVSVGQGSTSVRVRKDVIIRLAEPRFLMHEDDVFLPLVAQQTLAEPLKVKVTLRADAPQVLVVEGEAEFDRELAARGSSAVDVHVRARSAGLVKLEAQALSATQSDALKHGLMVLPFGQPWRVAEHRRLMNQTTMTLEVPDGMVAGSTGARVLVQGGLALEILDGLAFLRGIPYGGLEQTVNRFLPAQLVHRAFVDASQPSPLDEAGVAELVKRSMQELRGFQNDDGGFGYWPARPSEPEPTALALESLARLRQAGVAPPAELFQSAINGAQALLSQGRWSRDQRAWLVTALSLSGTVPSAELNALFRDRDALSTPSLARLVLAAKAGERDTLTSGFLESLRGRRRAAAADAVDAWPFGGIPRDPWLGSDQETTALALLALQAAGGRTDEIDGLVRRLRSEIAMRGCIHTRATATTVLALVRYVQGEGAFTLSGDVTVKVDGKPVGDAVKIDGKNPRAVIEIPAAGLTAGKHQVEIARTGAGEADVRLLASGMLVAKTVDPAGNVLAIDRRLLPFQDPDRPEPKYEEGFNCVEEGKRPAYVPPPALAQTVAGRKVTVRLALKAREAANYVVLEDPQPAGLEVIESGVRGTFDRFERRDRSVLFFFDHLAKGQEIVITYPCQAVFPGTFASMPAQAVEMYAPEVWGRSGSATLKIVGDASAMAAVPPAEKTPDHRLGAAADALSADRFQEVVDLLAGLPAKYALMDEAHDRVLSMLQLAYLRLERHAEAVKTRDALVARNPTKAALPVADRVRLGQAYLAVNDPERAREQFQVVIDGAFAAEQKPARFLQEIGRVDDAVASLEAAVRRYPATGGVPEVEREIAGLYASLPDPAVKGPVTLDIQARQWKNSVVADARLMAWYPLTPIAERAHFDRIGIFTLLNAPQRMVIESQAFRARFPKSLLLDRVLAAEARAQFALGKYDEVKPLAQRVIDEKWPPENDPKSAPKESLERPWMAYLLGKIAHVEGRLDDAVKWYAQAKDAVLDAMQSWKFFTDHELDVAAVTQLVPGAAPTIEVRVKNAAKLTGQIFPVDLTVLFAVRKSFARLNQADLAGITPQHLLSHETGVPAYKPGTVKLPLPDLKPGAYLAVISDGERSVTTVLLVSDWVLRLQHDETGVRAWLLDGKEQPVKGARLTAGCDGRVFLAGETDERGMLLITGVSNASVTVVAERGDRVAVAEK